MFEIHLEIIEHSGAKQTT